MELSKKLAESAMAQDCAVETWFQKALSRKPVASEQCLVQKLKSEFKASGDLRRLVLSIAASDASLYIKEPSP